MSNLIDHARRELELIGAFDKDGVYGGMVGDAVLELISAFAKQGHSGASAALVSDIFHRVARYEPLSPLTGDDSEWTKLDSAFGSNLEQNSRCSSVFREDGLVYDSEGIIFERPSGSRFTNSASRVPVSFPYTPRKRVVRVDENDRPVSDIASGDKIEIVFDGPPGPVAGRFVEVERDGKSIRAGAWATRPDGCWALRIKIP